MIRGGFGKTAAQTEQPMIMKRHVIGRKFTPVDRRDILPVDAFTQMDHKSRSVG